MASLMLVNPRKRRKAKAKTSPKKRVMARRAKRRSAPKRRRYVRNPIAIHRPKRTHRRKYRRNPIGGGGMKGIMRPVMPAAISAVGAIGLDLGWNLIGSKLPAALNTGPVRHVTKAIGALALGALASMVVKKDTANLLTTGALTVVFHSAIKETVQKIAPTVQLGDMGMNGLAEYFPDPTMSGMGEYMQDGIGYAGAGVSFDPVGDMSGFGMMGEGEYSPFVL